MPKYLTIPKQLFQNIQLKIYSPIHFISEFRFNLANFLMKFNN